MVDVVMPDGTVIKDVPAGTTKADLQKRLKAHNQDKGGPFLQGLGQSIAQGVSLGFSDEIAGLFTATLAEARDVLTPGNDGLSFGEVFEGASGAVRDSQREFAEQNPKTALAAEIGGGIATGGLGAARIAGSQVVRNLPRTTQFALSGAVPGAAFGVGAADPGNRTEGGVQGGTFGAIGGAALQPLAAFAGTIGRWAEGAFSSVFRGDKKRALQRIAEAFGDDGVDANKVRQNLDELGPNASISDAAGENTLGLVEGVANRPGPGRQVVRDNLEPRIRQAGDNIVDSARANLSRQLDDIETARSQILDRMQKQAAPLYDQAYRTQINNGSRILREMQGNKEINKIMGKAVDDVRSDVRLPDLVRQTADADAPNIAVWDAVKKRLDDKIGAARRAGKSNEASRLTAIKNRMLSDLDDQVPEYAQARRVWSDDSGRVDALDAGLDVFSKRRISLDEFDNMPQDQQELFRLGAARAIKQVIDETPDTLTGEPGSAIFRKIFGNKETREVLKRIFPDDASFQEFTRTMNAERTFRNNANQTLRNSATARRQAQQQSDATGLVADAVSMADNPASGALRFIGRLKSGRGTPGVDKNVAELLTDTEASAIKQALAQIDNAPGFARSIQRMTPDQMRRFLANPDNVARLEGALAGSGGTALSASTR